MNSNPSKNVQYVVPKRLRALKKTKQPRGRVFVDIAPEDHSLAQDIAKKLAAAGMDVEVFGKERKGGPKQLESAAAIVRKSDAAVFLLTPNSLRSDWMLAELGLAMGRELPVIAIMAGIDRVAVPAPFWGKEVVSFDQLDNVVARLSREKT